MIGTDECSLCGFSREEHGVSEAEARVDYAAFACSTFQQRHEVTQQPDGSLLCVCGSSLPAAQ